MRMNLTNLLPKGRFWNGKNIKFFFLGLNCQMDEIEKKIDDLFLECFPDTTTELLNDWMRFTGSQSREGVLSRLISTGGNTEDFFLQLARKFDGRCEILKVDPKTQFVSGKNKSGERISFPDTKSATCTFLFSTTDENRECEKLLLKSKPAHVKSIFQYKKIPHKKFICGLSHAGDIFYDE